MEGVYKTRVWLNRWVDLMIRKDEEQGTQEVGGVYIPFRHSSGARLEGKAPGCRERQLTECARLR